MSRILFAWELGANYGHLARDLPVAETLRAAGHSVFFVVRDTKVAAELLTPRGFTFVQAPVTLQMDQLVRPPANYAEILLAEGWGDKYGLLGRVKAWLGLIGLVCPHVIVADFAPSALLAARIANIPAIALGNGFEIPPAAFPLPSIRPWEAIPVSRFVQSETMVLNCLNKVMVDLGANTLVQLADIFPPGSVFTTFAELDHYGERPGVNYVGSIHGLEGSRTMLWAKGDEPKMFAYLRLNQRVTGTILAALAERNFRVICVVPGANKEFIRKHTTPNMTIYPVPIALSASFLSGVVVIGYGGHGTIAMTLSAGAAQLMIPQTVEQYLCAKRVEALGAGIALEQGISRVSVHSALDKLSTDSTYSSAAMRFANKNRGATPERAAAHAAEAILAACGECEHMEDFVAPLLN